MKTDKMHGTTVFKTLCVRQQKTDILQKQETNEVTPTTTPAYCLKRPSRLQYTRWSPEGAYPTFQDGTELRAQRDQGGKSSQDRIPEQNSSMERELQRLANGPLFQLIAVYQSGQCKPT